MWVLRCFLSGTSRLVEDRREMRCNAMADEEARNGRLAAFDSGRLSPEL